MRTLFFLMIGLIAAPTHAQSLSIATWLSDRSKKPLQIWNQTGAPSWTPARNVRVGSDVLCFEVEAPTDMNGGTEFRESCLPFTSIYKLSESNGTVSITPHQQPR